MPILNIMAIKCGFKLNIILKELFYPPKMAKFKNDIPIKDLINKSTWMPQNTCFCKLHTETVGAQYDKVKPCNAWAGWCQSMVPPPPIMRS